MVFELPSPPLVVRTRFVEPLNLLSLTTARTFCRLNFSRLVPAEKRQKFTDWVDRTLGAGQFDGLSIALTKASMGKSI